MSSRAISSLPSAEPIDEPTESSRIDDLLLQELRDLRQENIGLKREIKTLQENQDILFGLFAKLKAKHEHKPKDTRLLDELYKTMQARGLKSVDFATAARICKRSKARMLQLKGQIGEDMRFLLVPQKNKIVIRVR